MDYKEYKQITKKNELDARSIQGKTNKSENDRLK